jgi:hypothetical protein
MDFSEKEIPNVILAHALVGLSREELIGSQRVFGDPETLRTLGRQVGYSGPERGLVVSPSPHGVELFLHAMGEEPSPSTYFFIRTSHLHRSKAS